MANEPQQSDAVSSDSTQTDAEPTGRKYLGVPSEESGANEITGADEDGQGLMRDVRSSAATTTSGRTRDAVADIAGARAYRAGAGRLGKGLGVDLDEQKARSGLKFDRESIGNAREAFAQGKTDRAAGGKTLREGIREQNQARIAKSAAGSGGAGIAAGAGKQLGKEAVKDTAQVAAKTGAKAVPGLGLAASVDVKGLETTAKDTARELANLRVGRAAKRLVTGLGKSATITIFRASYDPYVIGFTGSLSLIVTFLLGSVLFFVPNALNMFERLIVGMIWALILVILCVALAVVVITTCSGLNVPGIVLKFAALFSTSAAAINSVCTNASILDIVKGL